MLLLNVSLEQSSDVVLGTQHSLHVNHSREHLSVDEGQRSEPADHPRRPAHLHRCSTCANDNDNYKPLKTKKLRIPVNDKKVMT